MTDLVNHPPHYADGWSNGAEVIDITEHLNFNRGNAVKYIARAGKKGNELEDLLKAEWYIQREIARLGYEVPESEELEGSWTPPGSEYTETMVVEGYCHTPSLGRVWTKFNEIPPGITVKDKDGDLWDANYNTYGADSSEYQIRDENWGPYTEDYGTELPTEWSSMVDIPFGTVVKCHGHDAVEGSSEFLRINSRGEGWFIMDDNESVNEDKDCGWETDEVDDPYYGPYTFVRKIS